MRYLYSTLTYLASPIAAAMVWWRSLSSDGPRGGGEAGAGERGGPPTRLGLGERFGLGDYASVPTLWVHAVSLGEVTAAAPLVRALGARHPDIPIVLTTATLTGRTRAVALFGDSIGVRYLPYDTPGSVRRFLRRIRPRIAIIMETELWPNLFHECRRRGIPLVLANARLSTQSVARYRRFGRLFRDVFLGRTYVAAQSQADADRFIAIGAEPGHTQVVGNLKFDIVVDAAVLERGRQLKSCWGIRPVWIAGSTHAGEEEAALIAHAGLTAAFPGALLLLVPRHPQRFQAVAELLRRRGCRFERRTGAAAVRPDTEVLLVDSVGELGALYASADVAFVGGSLVPVGGHNLLEPAAVGTPVVTGPSHSNARDIAQLLLREGAGVQVANAAELTYALRKLFANPDERQRVGANGTRVVEANRGSLVRVLEIIEALLTQPPAGDP